MFWVKFVIVWLLGVGIVKSCGLFGKEKKEAVAKSIPKTEGFVKDGFFIRFGDGVWRNRRREVWGRNWGAEYREDESLLFNIKKINASHCPHNVIFRIYRMENGKLVEEYLREEADIKNDEWADKDIYIFIHGFGRGGIHPECPAFAKAWLGVDAENPDGIPGRIAIVVDWGLLSGVRFARDSSVPFLAITTPFIYKLVIANIRIVAITLADFLVFIIGHFGANPQRIRLVGHSMGAQIAGNAGRFYNILRVRRYPTLEILRSITALDPADPWFKIEEHQAPNEQDPDPERKLCVEEVISQMPIPVCVGLGQAEFVIVVHTNPWKLGLFKPVGDIDLYVNLKFPAGRNQPYCKINYDRNTPKGILERNGCSHALALIYHIRSIQEHIVFSLFDEYPYFPIQEEDRKKYTKEPYSAQTITQGTNDQGSSKSGLSNPFTEKKLERPNINIQPQGIWPTYFGHYIEKGLNSNDQKLRSGAYSIKVNWDGKEKQTLRNEDKSLLEEIISIENMEHKDIQLNPYKPPIIVE